MYSECCVSKFSLLAEPNHKKGYEQQQFNNYLLRRCLPGNLIFYAKAEVKNMEYPYAAKDYTGYVKGFSVHQHKTDRHQQRDRILAFQGMPCPFI